MMIYEICAGVATLAFVILVIYLVITLNALKQSLKETQALMKKVDPLTENISLILENGVHITDNIEAHLEALTPAVDSIGSLGSTFEHFKENLETKSFQYKKRQEHQHEQEKPSLDESVTAFAQIVSSGILLWQNFKKGRK
jgi:uncharacterized protein YoxC